MNQKILFIDDDTFFLASIERQLREKFKLDICHDPFDALERIQQNTYAVIVSDHHMPGLSGVDLLEKTRTIAPQSVRILFTGKADVDVAIDAVNKGQVFRFLSKPCSMEKLAYTLKVALGDYKIKQRAQKNEFLALHDMLTGLPNRIYADQKMADALKMARRNKTHVGILFLDLDGFKNINDTYGHESGDLVLKQVAQLLTGTVREIDTVARIGGDEFIIIQQNLQKKEDGIPTANRIIEALKPEMEILTHKCSVGTSIGIALYPDDGQSAEELIKNADTAMYKAKKEGGYKFKFYAELK